uniref:interleukin-20 receptor subunit beta isoform X3 n=1 Tax=Panthera onca TaxID=9690 RepID=UPI002955BFC1|nr:interleukin-20 receptor subunit beta isoform X3 [Panthera onca]
MWFFYTLIPCLLIDGVAILPAPQNLSVQSTNMKHLLMWSPVMVPGEIIYYFVEYQGEYESLYMSHVWIPSSWCSPTKGPECDITDDITATVPYNLRVRATQGSETSAWSTLKPPFNRNSRTCQSGEEQGHSGAPGNHGTRGCILCEGPDIREGHRETQPFQPGRMCQGASYHQLPSVLFSLGTSPSSCRCPGTLPSSRQLRRGETLPLALALFGFVGFMLILVVVPLSIWKMGRLLRHSCCPVVVLPDTLKITNSPQKLISCRREEVEACATAMLSSEEPFRTWI